MKPKTFFILLISFWLVFIYSCYELQMVLTVHMCIIAWVASACKEGTTRLLWRIRLLST